MSGQEDLLAKLAAEREAQKAAKADKRKKAKVEKLAEEGKLTNPKGLTEEDKDRFYAGKSPYFEVKNNNLRVLDVQELLLWLLNQGAFPSWVVVKNKALVRDVALLLVRGWEDAPWQQWHKANKQQQQQQRHNHGGQKGKEGGASAAAGGAGATVLHETLSAAASTSGSNSSSTGSGSSGSFSTPYLSSLAPLKLAFAKSLSWRSTFQEVQAMESSLLFCKRDKVKAGAGAVAAVEGAAGGAGGASTEGQSGAALLPSPAASTAAAGVAGTSTAADGSSYHASPAAVAQRLADECLSFEELLLNGFPLPVLVPVQDEAGKADMQEKESSRSSHGASSCEGKHDVVVPEGFVITATAAADFHSFYSRDSSDRPAAQHHHHHARSQQQTSDSSSMADAAEKACARYRCRNESPVSAATAASSSSAASSSTSSDTPLPRLLALDCEMCKIADGTLQLARVTVIDGQSGHPILDELVKPEKPVTDYLTAYSGVGPEDLAKAKHSLQDVQRMVTELLDGCNKGKSAGSRAEGGGVSCDKCSEGCAGAAGCCWSCCEGPAILVGHSLECDLRALRLIHTRIIDTSISYPHPAGLPCRHALRFLVRGLLGRQIQQGEGGHDSTEDAIAALHLVEKLCYGCLRGEWLELQEAQERERGAAAGGVRLSLPAAPSATAASADVEIDEAAAPADGKNSSSRVSSADVTMLSGKKRGREEMAGGADDTTLSPAAASALPLSTPALSPCSSDNSCFACFFTGSFKEAARSNFVPELSPQQQSSLQVLPVTDKEGYAAAVIVGSNLGSAGFAGRSNNVLGTGMGGVTSAAVRIGTVSGVLESESSGSASEGSLPRSLPLLSLRRPARAVFSGARMERDSLVSLFTKLAAAPRTDCFSAAVVGSSIFLQTVLAGRAHGISVAVSQHRKDAERALDRTAEQQKRIEESRRREGVAGPALLVTELQMPVSAASSAASSGGTGKAAIAAAALVGGGAGGGAGGASAVSPTPDFASLSSLLQAFKQKLLPGTAIIVVGQGKISTTVPAAAGNGAGAGAGSAGGAGGAAGGGGGFQGRGGSALSGAGAVMAALAAEGGAAAAPQGAPASSGPALPAASSASAAPSSPMQDVRIGIAFLDVAKGQRSESSSTSSSSSSAAGGE